jgi:hypothetical protein
MRFTVPGPGRLALRSLAAVIALVWALAAATGAMAADSRQAVFASPEEAVTELVAAARTGDAKAMVRVLGPGSKEILESGDPVADKAGRERFVTSFDESHRIVRAGEAKAVLSTGKDDWPFPVPIVKDGAKWRFDAAAGREEILNRRIGRNELDVIQVLQAYVDAQREYYLWNPQGDKMLQYAQRIASTAGKRDGLYFPTKSGERPSPLGPLVDAGRSEGYSKSEGGKRIPFHGYYYRILKSQGPDAPGGAYDYVVQGRMIGGFAMVAWPATYDNSGVMTFVVNHNGIVYEKDLGPGTSGTAQKMTTFNPDKTWKRVEAR